MGLLGRGVEGVSLDGRLNLPNKLDDLCCWLRSGFDSSQRYYLLFIEVDGGIDIYGSVESGAWLVCPPIKAYISVTIDWILMKIGECVGTFSPIDCEKKL